MQKRNILLIALLICSFHVFGQEKENGLNQYIRSRFIDKNGKEIVGIIVPGKPPDKHREPVAIPTRSAVLLNQVPAFDWSFGCSATSAAMAAGYYDNNGYPDMYTGPANWGFMPMDNSIWGTVVINGETRSQCPLSATRNTVDGRTTRGHVDDYWIQYGSTADDPYITNGWTEHELGDCTGDFMGTNQSAYGSSDGSTTFSNYTDGSPLYDYTGGEPGSIDGCHGFRDFYESRGYDVIHNYSQYIYGYKGNTLGFTFNQYKQEIDSGRVVLIQLAGHTVLGYGYDESGTLVYLHDTWDYSDHTMVWGTSYSGLAHYGVCVVKLAPSTAGLVTNYSSDTTLPLINTTVHFTDLSWGNPTSWTWSITPGTYNYVGGTSASSQHPDVQFTAGGLYSITLTASNGSNTDSEVKTNYINAIDCSNFSLPLTEDFSDGKLPSCWENVDNIGNGQVWQFNNPGNRTINTTTGGNGFAILDSDHYGENNNQDADLESPVLDFSEYVYITLSFQHYFREFGDSRGTLSYSIDGGSNWTPIQTWTTTENATTFSQNMSAEIAGQSNVRFKWNYTGSWAYYWAIDDISITATTPGLWRGTTSTNWTTPTNWDDGVVPAETTNVTISPTASNWPALNGDFAVGTQCANLTIPADALMTVSGNFTIDAGKSLTFSGAGELDISGNWNRYGTFTPGAGTVTFSGTNPSSVNYNGTMSDITTYILTTIPKTFTHITDSILGPTGTNSSMNVPLGFTFNYLGIYYDSARICTNGWITLNKTGVASTLNQNLFTTTAPNTTLAPWWDDLKDDGTSVVSYNSKGSAPTRIFTVEWHRVLSYDSATISARVTFQAKLFESTNIIEFHYGIVNGGKHCGLESASIGIEDAVGFTNHFIEATTGSTTTGVSTLKSLTNWPTVNYRFSPPIATENFYNLKISKSSNQVNFNCNVNVAGTLTVDPAATLKINFPRTISVNGY